MNQTEFDEAQSDAELKKRIGAYKPFKLRYALLLTLFVTLAIAPVYDFLRPDDAVSRKIPDSTNITRVWWILCAILVFFMQVGFMLLETGYVRVRHMSGIALKNFLMLLASSLFFTAFGFRIMYGSGVLDSYVGWDTVALTGSEWQFYQTGFAAIAATIISGAIAERTTLFANIVIAIVMATIIYPIYGHWVWSPGGWLQTLGFHDFAGSAVVHFVGGIAALMGAWVVGPRMDRFRETDARINRDIGSRSLPLASCGVILLWIGWMGFNGGSIETDEDIKNVGRFILATCCAASAGGFSVMLLMPLLAFRNRRQRGQSLVEFVAADRRLDPFAILPAAMGGMVAMTASCDQIQQDHAFWIMIPIAIGSVGGLVTYAISRTFLCESVFLKFRIDDPVDAIAVHAGGGAAGILMASVFPGVNILVQAFGLLVALALTSLVAGSTFHLLHNRFRVLRCSVFDENEGLHFELRRELPPEFPLKTSYVAPDLKEDIVKFLQNLIVRPSHNLKALADNLQRTQFKSVRYFEETRNRMLSEVAHMARLAAFEAIYEPVSLRKALETVYDEQYGLTAYPESLKLIIPDRSDSYDIRGQSDMVGDAVETLLKNALRLTASKKNMRDARDSEYSPKVVCELKRIGDRVSLCVSDNGPGVHESIRRRLFEPFNKRGVEKGFGLGLFYASLVAETFRGQLVLSANRVGGGATFELILNSFRKTDDAQNSNS